MPTGRPGAHKGGMIRYRIILPVCGLLALPAAATAQPRAVLVPSGTAVVIPARGAAPAGPVASPRRARRSVTPRAPLPVAPPGPEPSNSPLLALPLAAVAAVLAATLSGGGSGLSAPSRTR